MTVDSLSGLLRTMGMDSAADQLMTERMALMSAIAAANTKIAALEAELAKARELATAVCDAMYELDKNYPTEEPQEWHKPVDAAMTALAKWLGDTEPSDSRDERQEEPQVTNDDSELERAIAFWSDNYREVGMTHACSVEWAMRMAHEILRLREREREARFLIENSAPPECGALATGREWFERCRQWLAGKPAEEQTDG